MNLTVRMSILGWIIVGTFCVPAPAQDIGSPAQGVSSTLSDITDEDFDRRSRPLFDGVLTGWEGHAYWFRTEQNAIVAGRLEEKIPENQFLCTSETFDNFDLRMQVRMRGLGRNAGVQFRSRRPTASDEGVPANEVVGYQADMGEASGRSIWGCLYDESRRREFLVCPDPRIDVPWSKSEPDANADANADVNGDKSGGEPEAEQTDWVSLRIVCMGDSIEIFVGGRLAIQFKETDPAIPKFGLIGLQVHSGPPTEAWYRHIRLLSL